MTKNQKEGKSEWGEKWNSLHCLPVCSPQQSESHLPKLENEIQQRSAALATRDDLLSWYQCPPTPTPKHNWHMGNLTGLQSTLFANIFFMIYVWSPNYVKISHYTEHISGQINLISSKYLLPLISKAKKRAKNMLLIIINDRDKET